MGGGLSIRDQVLAVQAGSVQFVGPGMKIMVDEKTLVRLDDLEGQLALTLDAYDEEDRLLIAIEQNEWISGDPLPWDFEFGYKWLKMRRKRGSIALSIDARSSPVRLMGELWHRGQRFDIGSRGIRANGVVQDAGVAELCLVALSVRINTSEPALQIVPDAEFGKGVLVSWPDHDERLRRGIEAYEKLRGDHSRN
jgi:hypothetical protein